jgi:hypothetical protein
VLKKVFSTSGCIAKGAAMKTLHFVIALLLCICASAAMSRQEAASVHFGTLPENWQTVVRGYYSMPAQLKDPYSAAYRFEQPRK